MSGGAIFQESLRRVMALQLPDEARRDVVAALHAAGLPPLLQFLYEAGHEVGLSAETLRARATAAFLFFAAGNLADDLVDGDVDYLDPPVRLGPTVQFLLQHLAYAVLVEGGVGPQDIQRIAMTFARAAGPQQLEVRTTSWTAARYREVGAGVAGCQWQAQLRVLWAGTADVDDAVAGADVVGMAIGFASHVAEDIRSQDPRFYSMTAHDRAIIVNEARAALDVVARSGRKLAQFITHATHPPLQAAAVAAWYDEKTRRILERYGPGPRVHYHTGRYRRVGDEDGISAGEARARLVQAQEAVVVDTLVATDLWRRLPGLAVLDCGCGLGGTSLLCAERGAEVTSITVAPSHVEVVRDFALRAGAQERIEVRLQDVADIADEARFDVALAFEASCYFDRRAFFSRMQQVLKADGRVVVVDLFAGKATDKAAGTVDLNADVSADVSAGVKADFDRVWRTDLGTLAEYDAAAEDAGFVRLSCDDISADCVDFWDLTRRDTTLALTAATLDEDERRRLSDSLTAHAFLQRAGSDGGLRHLRVVWGRP